MENLLNRMNEPDPRDINYLDKEISAFNTRAQSMDFNTIRDIPQVHDRLYQLGCHKLEKLSRMRT